MHVIQGDSAIVLKHFGDDHFDCIVTDPPHGLGGEHMECSLGQDDEGRPQVTITFTDNASEFMGANWGKGIGAFDVWRECLRVLKPGGHVWIMSSERTGGIAGFYLLLKAAGFVIDETQVMQWIALTGMPKSISLSSQADKEAFRSWLSRHREAIACPDHREPKDAEGKPTRCVECERIFAAGKLTRHDQRKAESAAVNGEYVCSDGASRTIRDDAKFGARFDGQHKTEPNLSLLTRLLTLHWPTSPAEQRAEWEAVVATPEGWDCGRPPGVRVKTGDYQHPARTDDWANYASPRAAYTGNATWDYQNDRNITAPSTPDACEWEGWRGSCAPLKPFAYPIIHACKPREGSYLANARKWGVGAFNIEAGRIPFAGEADVDEVRGRSGGNDFDDDKFLGGMGRQHGETFEPVAGGRTPANLLSYGDLLGELTKYASLDQWCEKLGLPTASAELLEAGLVYCPKSGKAEKERGLADFSGELPVRSPMNSSLRKCGKCQQWIGPASYRNHRPNACSCETPEPAEYVGSLPRKNTHPTCKPVALCAYLVALSTREGQRVLDPFCGSGSTGVACARLGRQFVGVELDAEGKNFCDIARARIAAEGEEQEPEEQPALELEAAK